MELKQSTPVDLMKRFGLKVRVGSWFRQETLEEDRNVVNKENTPNTLNDKNYPASFDQKKKKKKIYE